MRRASALWLLLFALYASTLGLDAFDDSNYAGDEPHYLLAAQSIVQDGSLDVKDDIAARSYAGFYPYALEPQGVETEGRLHEPHGVGLALLVAPAYAIAGETGVEILLAALAALALAFAYRLALRLAPDPWALGTTLAVGLSAPFLAYGSAVYPELPAAAALAGAALLALRLDEHVSRRAAFACFVLLGLVPWLGVKFLPAAVVIGAFGARSLFRARRRTLGVGSVEVALFSLALFVAVSEGFFGGPTPYSAEVGVATGANTPVEYLERSYRLVAIFVDRDVGLLRWAPVLALVLVGCWFLYHSRRERLARAVPELRAMERAGTMCAAAAGVQLLVAAFLAPELSGEWFPGRQLLAGLVLAVPLAALGMRHLPRVGVALALVSLVASVWLWLDVRLGDGGLAAGRPDAPFGPLTDLLPRFGDSAGPYLLAGAIGAALAALVGYETYLRDRRDPRLQRV